MTKQNRQIVFGKYNGRCAYCGCYLVKGWHVDHLEPIRRNFKYNGDRGKMENDGTCLHPERDTIENCMPSCASCNIAKHSMDLEGFRIILSNMITTLNKYTVNYKIMKRYGFIVEVEKPVRFYFEEVNLLKVCADDFKASCDGIDERYIKSIKEAFGI